MHKSTLLFPFWECLAECISARVVCFFIYDASKNYRTAGENVIKKQTSVKMARFSPYDIDNINSGLYNYKWVSDENVLSGADLNDLFSKVASMRHGVKFRKMPDGTFAIPIGANDSAVAFTYGRVNNLKIKSVVYITSADVSDRAIYRDQLLKELEGGADFDKSSASVESFARQKLFIRNVPQNVRNLQESERYRENSRSYVFDDNESEDGAGVSRNAENVGEIKQARVFNTLNEIKSRQVNSPRLRAVIQEAELSTEDVGNFLNADDKTAKGVLDKLYNNSKLSSGGYAILEKYRQDYNDAKNGRLFYCCSGFLLTRAYIYDII